jgi:hypothetical protein
VRKYLISRATDDDYGIHEIIETQDGQNLSGLLAKKGINVQNNDLALLIEEEVDKQRLDELRIHIMRMKPEGLSGYVTALLIVCGESAGNHMSPFKRLLREKNFSFTQRSLTK